jgi:hypothetical protein
VEKVVDQQLGPIKPLPSDKFRPNIIKKIIEPYLEKTLEKVKTYNSDDA